MASKRSLMVLATLALLSVPAFAGVAAGVYYQGNITLDGNGLGGESQTIAGNPAEYADWCGDPAPSVTDSELEKKEFWKVRVKSDDARIKLGIEPGSCLGDPSVLPEGTYSVKIRGGYMGPSGTGPLNCHEASAGTIIDDDFDIDAEGCNSSAACDPSNRYNLGSLAAGWYSLCVYNPSEPDGLAINFLSVQDPGWPWEFPDAGEKWGQHKTEFPFPPTLEDYTQDALDMADLGEDSLLHCDHESGAYGKRVYFYPRPEWGEDMGEVLIVRVGEKEIETYYPTTRAQAEDICECDEFLGS